MSVSAIFIGGPLDGVRKAFPNSLPPTYEYVATFGRLPAIVTLEEGANYPDSLESNIVRTTYRRDFVSDGEGRDQWFYYVRSVSQVDYSPHPTAEVKRLRKDLENERTEHRLDVEALIDARGILKKELADAQGRLSSIGNVLSAKDPGGPA